MRKSGGVLSASTALYWLLLQHSLLSLLSTALLLAIASVFSWNKICSATGRCGGLAVVVVDCSFGGKRSVRRRATPRRALRNAAPCCNFRSPLRALRRPAPHFPKLEVSEARVRALVTTVTVRVNAALALGWRLGSGQDVKQTLQALVALFLVSKLGGLCTFATLAYLCVFALSHVCSTHPPASRTGSLHTAQGIHLQPGGVRQASPHG